MNAAVPKLQCRAHPQREAAARCTSCGDFFCRECVTEHELQMLCAPCFRRMGNEVQAATGGKRSWLLPVTVVLQLLLGLMLVWFSFYLVGRVVIAIPSDFHEATLWEEIRLGGQP